MKAPRGRVIVKFFEYRREGVIIVPDKFAPQPVECEITSDSRDEWNGLLAIASLTDGIYFEVNGIEYCSLKRGSILMFYTESEGKTATVRPAGRAVIMEDEGRVEKVGSMFYPLNDNRSRPYAKVLAVGPGRWDFEEGDTIHFDRSKAVGIKINGQRALFIFEEHIYAMESKAA